MRLVLSSPPTPSILVHTAVPILPRVRTPLLLEPSLPQKSKAPPPPEGPLSPLRRLVRTLRMAAQSVAVVLFALLISLPMPPMAPALAAPSQNSEVSLPSITRMPPATKIVVPEVDQSSEIESPPPRPTKGAPRRVKTSFVTAAVNSVGPAVVKIDTERLVDRQPIEGYLFPGLEPDGPRREAGQGSGVILNEDGVILTNAHVIKNANKVTVTLTDGRTFEGVVKGSDEYMDLAAVKIKPSGKRLPIAPLGRSDDLQVGDWVIAIGNAVGLDSTVTLGIVSSLSRSAAEVGIPNKKVNFIQTDVRAAIALTPHQPHGPSSPMLVQATNAPTLCVLRAWACGVAIAACHLIDHPLNAHRPPSQSGCAGGHQSGQQRRAAAE